MKINQAIKLFLLLAAVSTMSSCTEDNTQQQSEEPSYYGVSNVYEFKKSYGKLNSYTFYSRKIDYEEGTVSDTYKVFSRLNYIETVYQIKLYGNDISLYSDYCVKEDEKISMLDGVYTTSDGMHSLYTMPSRVVHPTTVDTAYEYKYEVISYNLGDAHVDKDGVNNWSYIVLQ